MQSTQSQAGLACTGGGYQYSSKVLRHAHDHGDHHLRPQLCRFWQCTQLIVLLCKAHAQSLSACTGGGCEGSSKAPRHAHGDGDHLHGPRFPGWRVCRGPDRSPVPPGSRRAQVHHTPQVLCLGLEKYINRTGAVLSGSRRAQVHQTSQGVVSERMRVVMWLCCQAAVERRCISLFEVKM